MTIKLFVGLILLAIITLGVSIMAGLYHVGRLIFKKDERRESLKGAAKMGALFIISYAFLNGIWFNIKQPGMWTNIYPNDIKANIKLSTQDKTIDANDTVSHDDIDNLVRKKTIWPSHVTIEATNTKGQTHERAYLYRNNLKEKVHGNKPSAKTHGKITQVRYGKGKTVVTWYGLTIETREIPLLGLDVEYEPSTGTAPDTLFKTK